MRERLKPVTAFVSKLNNDWILNLSGMLAFNFLMASLPLLLIVLAVLGFTLGAINPELEKTLIQHIGAIFPSDAGQPLVQSAADNLRRDAGVFLIVGLISSIFLGSRFFIVLENCFGIIFRLRARELVQQNLMALTMLAVFIVLVPLFLLASIVPQIILDALKPSSLSGVAVLVPFAVFLATVVFAAIMFGVIYIIIPNQSPDWGHTWPGALLAGVLLVLYEKIFPWYTTNFLRPNNSGAIVGFAIVILIFYNFLAFIMLLGAELNSWVAGKRETMGDLQEILTEIDAQRAQLSGVIPAATRTDDATAGVADAAVPVAATVATPSTDARGHRPFFSALQEHRHGRTIVAGQIATFGLLAGAVVTWLLRRNAK
ncbi:MAG: YihY/virulence factor BrkB family protein [Ktedonobacterales bacterium]|nr:YihY/virulence factor BrkB family protein [Ktedonobacterales bacterium]